MPLSHVLPRPSPLWRAQLLGELLLDRANMAVMLRYVSEKDNLKLIMTMLKASHPNQGKAASGPAPSSPSVFCRQHGPSSASPEPRPSRAAQYATCLLSAGPLPGVLPSRHHGCGAPPNPAPSGGGGKARWGQCALCALWQDPSRSIQYEAFHIFKVGKRAALALLAGGPFRALARAALLR